MVTAYRSPWQNPYCVRWIGTARRDCLDHVIVWNKAQVRRTLHEFLSYYHADRTRQGLANDCPESRPVEPRSLGRVVELPRVGGLHHRNTRLAACSRFCRRSWVFTTHSPARDGVAVPE